MHHIIGNKFPILFIIILEVFTNFTLYKLTGEKKYHEIKHMSVYMLFNANVILYKK